MLESMCGIFLPTFLAYLTININQMSIDIPYMEHLGFLRVVFYLYFVCKEYVRMYSRRAGDTSIGAM